MAFVPKTGTQVGEELEADLKALTALTDFNPGSNAKGIVEAVQTQVGEAYFQMTELLSSVDERDASGTGLDRAAAAYDLERLTALPSRGTVYIHDDGLIYSRLIANVTVGATSLRLDSAFRLGSDLFPTSGYPYTVRIDESLATEEDVLVSANDTSTDTLTCAATRFEHGAQAQVAYVDGSSDKTIAAGLVVHRPATTSRPVATRYSLTGTAIIPNGNLASNPISVVALESGSNGNISGGTGLEWVSASPFPTALVVSGLISGGQDRELDAALRDRMMAQRQALSRGTSVALRSAVVGLVDQETRRRIASAYVRHDLVNDEVVVYVDDGVNATPVTVTLPTDSIAATISSGAGSVSLVNGLDWPQSGYALLSPENASQLELKQFTTVTYATSPHVVTLAGATANGHDIGDEMLQVEVLSLATEENQRRFRLRHRPIVSGSLRLWVNSGAGYVLQTLGSSYLLNRGTGEIEFVTGLPLAAIVVAHYGFYTGLIAAAQSVLVGNLDALIELPGFSAAGVRVVASPPTIRRVRVRGAVAAVGGITESQLRPLVQERIEAYITNLGIGADVVLARLIEAAMSVPGVYDFVVQEPSDTIAIANDERATPYDESGGSLVVIS
jgi:uncharacterized phage protein gp47/JayE